MLVALRARRGSGLTPAALTRTLGADARAVRAVRRMLRALENRELVERIEGRYRVRRDDGAVEARVESTSARGDLFAVDASGTTWRVAPGEARIGDRVLLNPVGAPDSARADLLHVVEGVRDRWVGILHRRGGMAYATPYRDDGDWWLRVSAADAGDARDGEVVELEPVLRRRRRPAAGSDPWARVTRRIGFPGEPDADFAAVVWRHRLPVEFPHEIDAELHAIASRPSHEQSDRADLRDDAFVTIDPDDARDFDDAVCAELVPDGTLRLLVAVADVSHFVRPRSALDREARRRGNSVYFPDRAIPMLPPLLSADLCSLRPDCDRLALVAELRCDAHGGVRSARFLEARIRSHARLTYAEAQAQLEGADGRHAAMLRTLSSWARQASRERRRRGGLDFELPGTEISYGADGRPDRIARAPRSDAHRLVEEAMLAANRAVAEWLSREALPVPYRNHLPPGPEDAALLVAHLRTLGIARDLPSGRLPSRTLARALDDTPAEQSAVVHALVLRHLRQARYGAASLGHYALAMRHYLHFTSPIRRYADLEVHRAVKGLLQRQPHPQEVDAVQRVAARTSFRERLAQRAEREMATLASCAFLRAHVGEEHGGTVTGLGRMGLFVTLDAWPIDGLVPAARLGRAEPDALGHALSLPGGRRIRLGERVRVRIASVDVARARIDLELCDEAGNARSAAVPRGQRSRRGTTEKRSAGRKSSRAAAIS